MVALASNLEGDFDLWISAARILELAVVALDTGCRGRELRNGGESFGNGVAMYAFSLVFVFETAELGRVPLRDALVVL